MSTLKVPRITFEMNVFSKLWILIFFLAESLAQDVYLRPSVRYLTVWEGEPQEIDCYITYTERKGDLRWSAQSSQGTYTVEEKTDDNRDGTFKIHRLLKFKSFTSSDAGIYTCSFSPRPGFGSQAQIKLLFQKKCEAGKYGMGCTSNCSESCKKLDTTGESSCSYKDGHCIHGCLSGYLGANCTTVCESGKYGTNCSFTCSQFCKDYGSQNQSWCDPKTGICLDGCRSGYAGSYCTTAPDLLFICSPFCKDYGSLNNSWCDPETGACLDGCQSGFTGKYCTVVEIDNIVPLAIGIAVCSCTFAILSAVIFCVIRCRRRGNREFHKKVENSGLLIDVPNSVQHNGNENVLLEDPTGRSV